MSTSYSPPSHSLTNRPVVVRSVPPTVAQFDQLPSRYCSRIWRSTRTTVNRAPLGAANVNRSASNCRCSLFMGALLGREVVGTTSVHRGGRSPLVPCVKAIHGLPDRGSVRFARGRGLCERQPSAPHAVRSPVASCLLLPGAIARLSRAAFRGGAGTSSTRRVPGVVLHAAHCALDGCAPHTLHSWRVGLRTAR